MTNSRGVMKSVTKKEIRIGGSLGFTQYQFKIISLHEDGLLIYDYKEGVSLYVTIKYKSRGYDSLFVSPLILSTGTC